MANLAMSRGWAPRSLADFGDGGAFPEIHMAQRQAQENSLKQIQLRFQIGSSQDLSNSFNDKRMSTLTPPIPLSQPDCPVRFLLILGILWIWGKQAKRTSRPWEERK